MRMTITEIRNIVNSVLIEQEGEIKVEPTEKCVDGHFSKFESLGQSEQEAYYRAFDTCVDRAYVNTDNLDVIHWFNFYEDPETVAEDFLKFNMKIKGALSAVGYQSFSQQVNLVKKGVIGLVLDGKVSLAFQRDAETERGVRVATKMPGKLPGSNANPERWIEDMILDSDSYELSPSATMTNEFIMIDPSIKGIVISEAYIKAMTADAAVNKEGKSTAALIKSIFEKLNKISMPIYNFEGNQINDRMNRFSPADVDVNKIIKKTLLGEKELKYVGSFDRTYDLFKNFAKYPSVPREDSLIPTLSEYIKKLSQLGNYNLIVDSKMTKKIKPRFFYPDIECFDPSDMKVKNFTRYQVAKRFIQGPQIYFKFLLDTDTFNKFKDQMNEAQLNVLEKYPVLLHSDILGYFTVVVPEDFGVASGVSPTVENSYLPYAAAEIIKNFDVNKINLPNWNLSGPRSDNHLFIIDRKGNAYNLYKSFQNQQGFDQFSYDIFKQMLFGEE